MRTLGLLVAVVFVAGMAVCGQAATHGVFVNISGRVTSDNEATGKALKTSVQTADFLRTITNAVNIVLVYDDAAGTMNLQAVDSGTNSVAVLAISSSVAVLQTTGAFSVNLSFGDCFFNTPNLVISNAALGVTNNSGDLSLTGKLSPTSGSLVKIGGKLIGVLNDPACTGEPARMFKGAISQAGAVFDATSLGL